MRLLLFQAFGLVEPLGPESAPGHGTLPNPFGIC